MSPPPLPSSNTLPLTPPFSPVTTTANDDQQHPFHPLIRVETLELDAQPRLQEEYNTDEEDPTDSEDEDDDNDDEMLPASFNNNNNKFMDGEGEGIGGWKEKGTGGKGKLRVVIVTGES